MIQPLRTRSFVASEMTLVFRVDTREVGEVVGGVNRCEPPLPGGDGPGDGPGDDGPGDDGPGDDGPGIPPDNLEAVFKRFYTDRPKGAAFGTHSGLGLAIARQIVKAHGGSIIAENRAGADGEVRGARFVILLPAERG